MRARVVVAALVFAGTAAAGCSLFVSLDGLNGNAADAGNAGDATSNDGSGSDGASTDGGAEAEAGRSYAEEILSDAPLAYFHFDETSGSKAKDSSGNGHDATLRNGFAVGQTGAFPGSSLAVHFDGTSFAAIDDSVSDAGTPFDFVANAPFTFEEWVRFDVLPVLGNTEYTFFSKEQSLGGGGYVGIDFLSRPTIHMQRENDPDNSTTEAVMDGGLAAAGQWFYVVTEYDGVNISVFVDTVLTARTLSSTKLPVVPVPFLVGAEDTGGSNSIVGSVDEAAVYPTALGTDRLAAHFHAAGR